MFDLNEHSTQCKKYLSNCLLQPVEFIEAERLTMSTRVACWRLDVEVNGAPRSNVLQLDTRGIVYQ